VVETTTWRRFVKMRWVVPGSETDWTMRWVRREYNKTVEERDAEEEDEGTDAEKARRGRSER